MKRSVEVLIVGGGLAGLTAAIDLARHGYAVVLLEKEAYPHHKVCGEYISNEVLSYLQWLGADPAPLSPVPITHMEFSSPSGKKLSAVLPLGGFGLSRYSFDHHLYGKALQYGAVIEQEQVTAVEFREDTFEVHTHSGNLYEAKVVIGAFGKRSSLDVKLERDFIKKTSPWLAVKGHYKGLYPDHVVGLHSFDGGYCGVSKVEGDIINICYLVQYSSFKQYKNIDNHREQVLYKNPVLREILSRASPLFEKPLTISQVSFARKAAVEEHILMTGDTAGLIHPLCGNGMAMAIHSAKIATEQVSHYLDGHLTRIEMEQGYADEWNSVFRSRMRAGGRLATLLQHKAWAEAMTGMLKLFPGLLPAVIRRTHGRPIEVSSYWEAYEV